MSDRAKFACVVLACLALVCLARAAETSSSSGAGNSSSSSSSSSSGSSSNHNNNHNHNSHNNHHHPHKSTATQARQSPISVAASLVGALGSMVPGLITNIAPLVLLFGIGALMMPSLGMGAMGLLRESRRSASDQLPMQAGAFPQVAGVNPFGQFAAPRPLQSSPQDVYYFTKRSLASLPSFNSAALLELLERVARAIDNADKRYN